MGIPIMVKRHIHTGKLVPLYPTHWPLADLDSILKVLSSILFCWLVSLDLLMIMSSDECHMTKSRPNWIMGPGPKSEPAGKSESRGPENWVSRWRRPNSDIYSQNHHFGLVYDMIYQFLGMEAKNCKFGMFCQQCHPSVASGDADIRQRNASRIHTCHLFTS